MATAPPGSASAPRAATEALAERIYADNRQRLLKIARRNCASAEDAEEALHDALLIFIERFDPQCGSPPLPWLMLTLKRRCWAIYGRRRELGEALAKVRMEGAQWRPERSVEELVEVADLATTLGRKIRALRPEERLALGMLAAGYSYREIGERCGWTPKRVDRVLQRARGKLRGIEGRS